MKETNEMSVSFGSDIKPLFRSGDVRCMRRRGVFLDNYDYMSDASGNDDYLDYANARKVYCYLIPEGCVPRMPEGGPYWNSDQLDLFKNWMDNGFQR